MKLTIACMYALCNNAAAYIEGFRLLEFPVLYTCGTPQYRFSLGDFSHRKLFGIEKAA